MTMRSLTTDIHGRSHGRTLTLYLLLVILLAGLSSCQTTEQVTRRGTEGTAEADSAAASGDERRNLAAYTNRLSDVFATQQHDMPEALLRTYQGDRPVQRDPFDGFRVQIVSTRNVAYADSTAKRFRLWADTTFTGYRPRTYVLFQQPYYKVHVGDFHERDKAYSFSRMVKRKYPDAWVVHDRINPSLTPADTVTIELNR